MILKRLVLIFRLFGEQKVCKHHHLLASDVPHPVLLTRASHGTRDRRSVGAKMRIKVLYHESIDKLPADKRDLIRRRIVPQAVEYWEDVLTVVNPVTNIRLNRKCQDNQYFLSPDDPTQYCKEKCVQTMCGEFQVPLDHLEPCHVCDATGRSCKKESEGGKGVSNVDFVLYVSSVTTSQCLEAVGIN